MHCKVLQLDPLLSPTLMHCKVLEVEMHCKVSQAEMHCKVLQAEMHCKVYQMDMHYKVLIGREKCKVEKVLQVEMRYKV